MADKGQHKSYRGGASSSSGSSGFKKSKVYEFQQIKEMTGAFANLLGNGSYAEVYKGKENYNLYAIKVYEKKHYKQWAAEKDILQIIQGKSVVRLHGIASTSTHHYLILDFYPNGLEENYKGLKIHQVLRILKDLADGLQKIHNSGYVYGDLKPGNIMLNEDMTAATIVDFGSVVPVGKALEHFTRAYAPPEFLRSTKAQVLSSTEYDVYSFGVVMLQLLMKSDVGTKTSKDFVQPGKGKTHIAKNQKLEKLEDVKIAKRVQILMNQKNHKSVVAEELQCPKDMGEQLSTLAKGCVEESHRRPKLAIVVEVLNRLTQNLV